MTEQFATQPQARLVGKRWSANAGHESEFQDMQALLSGHLELTLMAGRSTSGSEGSVKLKVTVRYLNM